MGWDGPGPDNQLPKWPGFSQWITLIGMHWPGWLLTAFAVSFGAPFWFDLLSKFMTVRSTLKPKEETEGSLPS